MDTPTVEKLLSMSKELGEKLNIIVARVEDRSFPASKALVVLDKQLDLLRSSIAEKPDLEPLLGVVIESMEQVKTRISVVYKRDN